MHEDQNPSALLSFLDSLKYADVAGDGTRTGMALREASRVRARFLLFLKFLKLTGGGGGMPTADCDVVVTTLDFQAGRPGFNLWPDLYSRS